MRILRLPATRRFSPTLVLAPLMLAPGAPGGAAERPSDIPEPTGARAGVAGEIGDTRWTLRPSMKYDALCLLNVLTGDSFYIEYYPEVYERWEPVITPEARRTLADLKRVLKDENGRIISAFLSLYLSASPARTLDAMVAAVDDPAPLRARLRETPYYSDSEWALFERVAPHVREALRFLEEAGFPGYWKDSVAPGIRRRIEEIRPDLPRYDVIGRVERLLGRPAASDEIEVLLLKYSQPHGIRITGNRFLTDAAYPFRIVLRNAVHEMLHPPYDLASDPELADAVRSLQEDPFLRRAYEERDPAYGYNSFTGLVEEDVVQALEQRINEAFGVAADPRERWERSDDGLHVFAAALHHVLDASDFGEDADGTTIRDFLVREVTDGRLRPGRIRRVYDAFYAGEPRKP